jgi:hypothetical protein
MMAQHKGHEKHRPSSLSEVTWCTKNTKHRSLSFTQQAYIIFVEGDINNNLIGKKHDNKGIIE